MAGDIAPVIIYDDIDSGKTLNKEGLLELSSQIKSYINANSGGGGSSYTAGDGISIDADGVIKTINSGFSSYGPNWILGNFYFNGASVANYYVVSTTNKDDFINCLKAGLFVQYKGADNITITGADIVPFPERQGLLQNCIYKANINGNGKITTTSRIFNSQVFTFINSNNIYVLCGNIIIGSADASYFCWMFRGIRFQANSGVGLTSTFMNDAINEVATNLNTRIPAAPTTDGTYTLQCVVSSGTPTYSWVSV